MLTISGAITYEINILNNCVSVIILTIIFIGFAIVYREVKEKAISRIMKNKFSLVKKNVDF